MTPQELPRALQMARASRESSDLMLYTPAELWKAAQVGPMLDRKDLYRHAMIEAGYIVANATGAPYVVCPECGWGAAS